MFSLRRSKHILTKKPYCTSSLLDAEPVHSAEASVESLSELNPYVEVRSSSIPIANLDDDAQAFLKTFTLVILADTSLQEAQVIDDFCRAQTPPIGVVFADVKGLFSMLFVDFGTGFEVIDSTGEELKETYISSVTKEAEAEVTTVANHMHRLEDGDMVSFREASPYCLRNVPEFSNVPCPFFC